MLIIGLLGRIASGKSAVAAELVTLGAVVLNADEAAHRVINSPDVKAYLVERWGPAILHSDGEVNRRAIAGRVFLGEQSTAAEREFLEGLMHPKIRAEFESRLKNLENSRIFAAVIDAPLLLEAGWDDICDILLFVDSPREDCVRRAKTLRNWSLEEFAARQDAQMPIEEKRRKATHVIDNAGTFDQLRVRVQEFWRSLDSKKTS